MLPGNHFVALGGGGGGGGVSSGHKCKIQLNAPPPPVFYAELQCKRGAYNRASTVLSTLRRGGWGGLLGKLENLQTVLVGDVSGLGVGIKVSLQAEGGTGD